MIDSYASVIDEVASNGHAKKANCYSDWGCYSDPLITVHLKNCFITSIYLLSIYLAGDIMGQHMSKWSSKTRNFRFLAVPADFLIVSGVTNFLNTTGYCI